MNPTSLRGRVAQNERLREIPSFDAAPVGSAHGRPAGRVLSGVAILALGTSIALGLGVSLWPRQGRSAAAEERTGADEMKKLRSALKSGDLTVLDRSLQGLIRIGGEELMKDLTELALKVSAGDDRLYWGYLRGVASFVDEPALKKLGEFISKQSRKPIARDFLYVLGANRTRYAAHALGPVLLDGPDDLRILAAEQIGGIRSPESVDYLVGALEKEEARKKPESTGLLLEEIVRGLTLITGQEFGSNSVNWKGWWGRNRSQPLRGIEGKSDSRTGTATDYLSGRRKQEFAGLESAPTQGVIVLSARYDDKQLDLNNDNMEKILERMKVPHEVVTRDVFDKFDLSKTGAILVNCAQYHELCICPTCEAGGGVKNRLRKCTNCDKHDIFSAKLTPPQIKKLQEFVARGGYLFCEDWLVKEFLEKAYPKQVTAGKSLEKSVVDVSPARGQTTHPYLRGIFVPEVSEKKASKDDASDGDEPAGRTVVEPAPEVPPEDAKLVDIKFRWTIDSESFALDVSDPSVITLLSSGDLEKKSGSGAVAVAFRPGSQVAPGNRAGKKGTPGVVLSVLSHFGKQGRRKDEHTLENLLLNFLIDANVARESRVPPPKKKK
jgi:hypothetical protein